MLAAPRLLVLNKQRAEIRLGDRLAYDALAAKQAGKNETDRYIDVGTQLRVRPFVSPDGTVRLEVHAEHTTGHWDEKGVSQTHSQVMTTNVKMADGATVVISGPIYTEPRQSGWAVALSSWVSGIDSRDADDVRAKKQLVVLVSPQIWKR